MKKHPLIRILSLLLILSGILLSSCSTPPDDGGADTPILLPRNPDGTVDWEEAERIAREIWEEANPPEPTPTPAPTPEPTPEPTPDEPEEKPYTRKIVKYQNGFLWKPISESNGKLVVLLPSSVDHNGIDFVDIVRRSDDARIGIGRYVGRQHNGNRPHFRFPNPGISYGNDLILRQMNKDGTYALYAIPEGGARVE